MAIPSEYQRGPDERVSWLSSLPYISLHVGAVIGLFVFPLTWEMVALTVGLYYLRMFGITAGYHRYFSHRGFKTSRWFQFVLALLGATSSQKGVLWWSGLHRHHHKHSDQPEDIHSPRRGFWWSHHLWILCPKYDETPKSQLREFADYPELLWLNKYWIVPPLALAGLLLVIGGWSASFYGAVLSTVLLYHGTFFINSLTHVFGSRRYETSDTSRNSFLLALLTMGEGWHNNHHYYQSTANQGFFWWEVDLSYYLLKVLSWFGIVWDLRTPPQWVLEGKRRAHGEEASFSFPAQLIDDMATLSALKAAPAESPSVLGELALKAAETAAEVAERAAKVAQDTTARMQKSATEAAERAAALAAEAAEAAGQSQKSWSERAALAAQQAAAAAARARGFAAR